MGDINKLLTYANLQSYDTLIKSYISDVEAESLHKVLLDTTNGTINFYKDPSATLSDTADFTINIPANLDSTATIATASNGVVTLKAGLIEADGIVTNSSDSDITLAKVATTGTAADVAIVDAGGLITADNVEGALQELATASQGGVASKTVYITETAGSTGDLYSKRYGIYQGATGSSSSPVAGEKLADIDIPKDMVVVSGSVGTVTTPDVPYEGAQVGDKYIDLVIANATSDHIYIPANSLVDIYTAEQSASQIQLVIDNNNEISATIVAGSVTATELAADSVVTAKILDGNVTKAKLAQTVQDSLDLADSAVQSVTASDPTTGTNGTFVVDGTEVAIKGLGSAAYTASTAYDAAGTAQGLVNALDSNTNTLTATSDSSLAVITEVGITDGLLSSVKTNTLGSAATHADTDFMASADYTLTTESEIEALFD